MLLCCPYCRLAGRGLILTLTPSCLPSHCSQGSPWAEGGSQGIPGSPGVQDQPQLSITHSITLVVFRPLLFSFLAVIHWQL